MPLDWTRSNLHASAAVDFEPVASPRVQTDRPWILFVGADQTALERAARGELSGDVLSPPSRPPLPIVIHELSPPELLGERTLYAPRLDAGFYERMGCAGTPLYVLPKLTQLASEGKPLAVIATALESRAGDLIAQRGLASRFEIRRVPDEQVRTSTPPIQALHIDESGALGHVFAAVSFVSGLSRKEPKHAVASLKTAIEIDPDLPAAHYELGKALIQTNDMEGALAAFRRTTELLPEFASAWANLGAALGEMQQLDEAARTLRRAVELDPLSHALHSNLGVTFRDQGKLDDAAAAFEQVLSLAPDFVFGHYNLASVRYLEGRYDEAITCFEKAQSMDPKRSPRQGLMLALARLANGDTEGALCDYRDVFDRLDAPMKRDMRKVAEWDLQILAKRHRVNAALKEAAALLRTLV